MVVVEGDDVGVGGLGRGGGGAGAALEVFQASL